MKDEFKKLGVLVWRMFVAFVSSKKVLTGALTGIAAIFIEDTETRDRVVAAGLALLLAIGMTDFGKAKAIAVTTEKTTTSVDSSGSGVSVTKTNENI